MTTNLFHNASLKLTAIYLCIIMVISLLFSIGLYRVSAQEIERGIRTQGPVSQILRTRNAELIADLREEQNKAILEAQSRIKSNLVLINLIILFGGGFLSYFLAKRTLEPIEQAHEAQSRFTADASHELRTPITAMRAETELTLTDSDITLQKTTNQLKSNIEELDKLTELSEGLLQLARFENAGLETDRVGVSHIIEQAIENVQSKAHKKNINLTAKDIPDVQIHANQSALVQTIVILLDNAVKHSKQKSVVTVSARKLKNSVRFIVSDSGAGILASDIPHIFDRFYRADNSRTKNQTHGYGIGLSIAKTIVELHRGKISVKSTPQKGTTFTVSIPV